MIQYRKSDGTLGEFDNYKFHSIEINGNSFTINLRYRWVEFGWSDEKITDIIELRIG